MARLNSPLTRLGQDRGTMYGARATSTLTSSIPSATTSLVSVLTDSSGDAEFDLPTGTKGVILVETGAPSVSFTFDSADVIPQIIISGATADTTWLFLALS